MFFCSFFCSGNIQLMEQFNNGTISAEQLQSQWETVPDPVKSKDYHRMARQFMADRGWAKQKVNTTGNYLPYQDPRMAENLDCIKYCITVL